MVVGRRSSLSPTLKEYQNKEPSTQGREKVKKQTKNQKTNKAEKIRLTASQDTNRLAEDSIYSAERKNRLNNTAEDSVDELYDPTDLNKTALTAQLNKGPWSKPGFINVATDHHADQNNDYQSHLNATFQEQLQHQRLSQKMQTEGGQRSHNNVSAIKHRSNFHNYVCKTLLDQFEKPAKVVMSFHEKMSNPASSSPMGPTKEIATQIDEEPAKIP